MTRLKWLPVLLASLTGLLCVPSAAHAAEYCVEKFTVTVAPLPPVTVPKVCVPGP